MDQRSSVPLIQQLHTTADGWREAELKARRKMLAKGDNLRRSTGTLSRGAGQENDARHHGWTTRRRKATK
jgi:glutamyl-tRNA reductase